MHRFTTRTLLVGLLIRGGSEHSLPAILLAPRPRGPVWAEGEVRLRIRDVKPHIDAITLYRRRSADVGLLRRFR
jgi:hypothetical protein